MVAMKLASIAVLATVAVAAPTTAVTTTTEAKSFSFSKWVDDIINPDVVALTPEQAVEAYYQSINATTSTHDSTVKAKRALRNCASEDSGWRVEVDAAAKCVNEVAGLGNIAVKYEYGVDEDLVFCGHIAGGAMIKVNGIYPASWRVTAAQLAVAGGHIMDGCTWGGKTGGSIYEDFNDQMRIDLRRK